jgi:hypothetical protein
MAVTVIKANQNISATTIVVDTNTNSTAQDNTTSAAGTLYSVEVDNTGNAGYVYFKMADTVDATGGTTPADLVFAASGSATANYNMPSGVSFVNGFSHWCVTSPTGSSVANPGSAVTVRYTVVSA